MVSVNSGTLTRDSLGIRQGHSRNEFPGSQLGGHSTQASSHQQRYGRRTHLSSPKSRVRTLLLSGGGLSPSRRAGELQPHGRTRLSAGTRPSVTACFLISNPNSCKLCKSRCARAPE